MSDFVNGFWSWYVAAISLVSVLACGLLLYLAGKATVVPHSGKADDNTTGHVWDGNLREYNNPLPRWWLWLFILTIVFALVYLAIFPGLGRYKGLLKWSTEGEHQQDVTQLRAQVAPLYAAFAAQPVEALAKDKRALAVGERLFMNNCSQCHGSDGAGSKGFPNLTNANTAWLGERGAAHIVQTVTNGRTGLMPAMGAAVGGDPEISEVANYVLSLSGSPHNEIKAFSGKTKFSACAACHGVDGKGNKALGAPNLTDDYWLHGWGEAAIVSAIKYGKNNVMPAQSSKLSAEQIHVVAAYVLSLSQSAMATTATSATTASTAPKTP
jgi:cytochrome c oxidase cbb3-type subunit III